MSFTSSWSLRSHFRFYSLLTVLLPCVLMAAFLSYYFTERLHDRSLDELRRTLTIQKQFLETWLSDRQRDVVNLSRVPGMQDNDHAKTRDSFRRFVSLMPEFKGVVLTNASGMTVLDTFSSPGIDVSDRAYFTAGKQGRSYISDLIIGRATGTRIIIFSSPVEGFGEAFKGVVFATVSMDVIDQAMAGVRTNQGARVLLLDRSGLAVAGEPQAQPEGKPARHPAMDALRPDAESFYYTDSNGVEMVAVSARLSVNGWVLVGTVPKNTLSAAVRPVVAMVFSLGLLSFLIISPLALNLARAFENVLSPMARYAADVAKGRYDQPPPAADDVRGPSELAVLAQAFETMRMKIISDMRLLETMALTDELTGLPNRRFLMEEGARLLELSARNGKPCSCLIIDADHFKAVNDMHGHARGDAVLAALAAGLKRCARESDLIGRLGGEEFLVVCANTSLEEATVLAERILTSTRQSSDPVLSGLGVTVSIGIATSGGLDGKARAPFDRLLRMADTCLYAAKDAGRDRYAASDCDGCVRPPAISGEPAA